VVFPQGAADVQEIVRICAAQRAGDPFGTGTSLEGHVNAPYGGVSIDVRDMNRVLAVHAEDFDCVVEPGITRKALNEHLRDQGLFFRSIRAPTRPRRHGGDALLGHQCGALRHHEGQCAGAERGAGERRGDEHRPARKILRRLRPHAADRGLRGHARRDHRAHAETFRHPEAIAAGVCPFPSVEACCNAAILTIQSGIRSRASSCSTHCRSSVQRLFQACCRRRRCCS
jgi:D-lactate dehydrogenase (cytochrome)